MLTDEKKSRKLSKEIMEYLVISIMISLFAFFFFYLFSTSIVENYMGEKNMEMSEIEEEAFRTWTMSICVIASICLFVALFLFMTGQKLSYLLSIIKGVKYLQERQLDFDIEVEGDDELALLAENINYLARSRKELEEKEREINEQRERFIKELSHDIRTPLTSLISYSEIMRNKKNISGEEMESYIKIIQAKSNQIKELTDRLLTEKDGEFIKVDSVDFLMRQMVEEWEEILEERFICNTEIKQEEKDSAVYVNILLLQRIMDNLISNVEKYASPQKPVELQISRQGETLSIYQSNYSKETVDAVIESHQIGIKNIEAIAHKLDGDVNIESNNDVFTIVIRIKTPLNL